MWKTWKKNSKCYKIESLLLDERLLDEGFDVVGIESSDNSNISFSITDGVVGNLIGEKSEASYAITLKDTFAPIDTNDKFADNEEFESIGNNFIDFTEINPFGEVDII